MFGLEGDKSRKKGEFIFDIEKEAKNQAKGNQLKGHISGRIREVKAILRNGQDKEHFDQFGVLLHGYTSLQKVIARVNKKG